MEIPASSSPAAWYLATLASDPRPTLARSTGERGPPNMALTVATSEEPRPEPKRRPYSRDRERPMEQIPSSFIAEMVATPT